MPRTVYERFLTAQANLMHGWSELVVIHDEHVAGTHESGPEPIACQKCRDFALTALAFGRLETAFSASISTYLGFQPQISMFPPDPQNPQSLRTLPSERVTNP